MNWPRPVSGHEPPARPRPRFVAAALALGVMGLLGACGPQPVYPTLAPTIAIVWSTPATVVTTTPGQTARPTRPPSSATPELTAVVQVAKTQAGTSAPAAATSAGIKPDEALLQRPQEGPPEIGLAGEIATGTEDDRVEWRPPPVSVPYSLHPDDHYWLARPLPSGKRTYDLEWYPYGNQPWGDTDYRVHHGQDFPNKTGTPVFAASSGEVIWAGPLPNAINGVNYYGNTVIIKHDWQWLGQDVYTLYAHTLELFVNVGDYVRLGQLIAGVGASGEVSGPHLHFEVRVGNNDYSSTRNPALWLAPYEGWGTLAGRFMDSRGVLIHGALVTVTPLSIDSGVETAVRRQHTYAPIGVNSDDVWQENFVVADLPAGEYQVVLSTAGQTFRRTLRIRPGLTNYIIVQADFIWAPTAVPTATPTTAPEG